MTGARSVEAARGRSRRRRPPQRGSRRRDRTEVIRNASRAGSVKDRTSAIMPSLPNPPRRHHHHPHSCEKGRGPPAAKLPGDSRHDSPNQQPRWGRPPHLAPADSLDREPRRQPARPASAGQQQERVGRVHEPQRPPGGVVRRRATHRGASHRRGGRRTSPSQSPEAASPVSQSPAGPAASPWAGAAGSGSVRRRPCLGSVDHHHAQGLP